MSPDMMAQFVTNNPHERGIHFEFKMLTHYGMTPKLPIL